MAMKSGNADPKNENFSPEKINENTLKNNPKISISPIKIENEKNQKSPFNSVDSTPVGTPKRVIGKSGKKIIKMRLFLNIYKKLNKENPSPKQYLKE